MCSRGGSNVPCLSKQRFWLAATGDDLEICRDLVYGILSSIVKMWSEMSRSYSLSFSPDPWLSSRDCHAGKNLSPILRYCYVGFNVHIRWFIVLMKAARAVALGFLTTFYPLRWAVELLRDYVEQVTMRSPHIAPAKWKQTRRLFYRICSKNFHWIIVRPGS